MSFMGNIDSQTQRVGGGAWREDEEIDHAASAKANVEAVGDDLVKAFTPDKIKGSIDMIRGKGGGDMVGMGVALGCLMLPWTAAVDVLEVGVMPLVAVKDGADAAVHGVIAGFKKLSKKL
jgi:hypothetical protein